MCQVTSAFSGLVNRKDENKPKSTLTLNLSVRD